jgi:hypothetical protein
MQYTGNFGGGGNKVISGANVTVSVTGMLTANVTVCSNSGETI